MRGKMGKRWGRESRRGKIRTRGKDKKQEEEERRK